MGYKFVRHSPPWPVTCTILLCHSTPCQFHACGSRAGRAPPPLLRSPADAPHNCAIRRIRKDSCTPSVVGVAVFSQPNGRFGDSEALDAPNHNIVCGLGSHGCGRGTFPRHRGRIFSLAGFVFVRKEGPHWIAIVTPEAELPTAIHYTGCSGLPNRYCIYTGSSPYAYGQKSFDFTSPRRFLSRAAQPTE